MAYTDQQNTLAPPPPTLMEDSKRLNDRLHMAVERASKIADLLHGSAPHPMGQIEKDCPTPTLRRHLDAAHDLINRLEGELSRIDDRL